MRDCTNAEQTHYSDCYDITVSNVILCFLLELAEVDWLNRRTKSPTQSPDLYFMIVYHLKEVIGTTLDLC